MEIILDDLDLDFNSANNEESYTLYDSLFTGAFIQYMYDRKIFYPGSCKECGVILGTILDKEENDNIINVLYKGFFLKNPIKISNTIKNNYVQTYVKKEFQRCKESIIKRMPRVKKLKRINFKMITKDQALILTNNINYICTQYSKIFGENYASEFKASLVTTPFFINDNNTIKLYKIENNELTNIDVESSGNFLAYFSFKFQQ